MSREAIGKDTVHGAVWLYTAGIKNTDLSHLDRFIAIITCFRDLDIVD